MDVATTYCRICPATCGLEVELEGGRITKVRGDEANPLTRGFTCTKGRHIADFLAHPHRLQSSRRRTANGGFADIGREDVVAEIAGRLRDLIDANGPDCVALYTGTQASMSSLTLPFATAFLKAIGSRSRYSTMSVDQASKWVAEARLGRWAAGAQRFDDADVWMFVGTNPLVSMQGGYFTGFPIHDGMQRIDEARRRGLQLVVVDPRLTELAARADLHLRLRPGTDAVLFAGLVHLILAEELHDREFCTDWVPGLDTLRRAVEPFAPEVVAQVCDIAAVDLRRAATMFATARRGMATSGTGPDMGPDSDLAEHLIQTLNVICGRFPRAGDELAGSATLGSAKPAPAQPISPDRQWEQGTPGFDGFGRLNGELPVTTLPSEIRRSDAAKVRALIVVGGDPATAIPDSDRMVAALGDLELLVTIDPFMASTSRLADYVVAPVLHLERPDTTRAYESLMDRPFAQYTPAVVEAPPGTIDDWEFFCRLAGALGHSVAVAGREYRASDPVPSTDDVLAAMAGRARLPLAEVRRHPHGVLADLEPICATAPDPGTAGRFDVAPADVQADLRTLYGRAATAAAPAEGDLLLTVRRGKATINSTGPSLPAVVPDGANPCCVHPDDLIRLGIAEGAAVSLVSAYGTVSTTVRGDTTLKPGTVSLMHGFGGVNVNHLLSGTEARQAVSGMPHMTAVPVRVAPAP